jgi:hypothetical protein
LLLLLLLLLLPLRRLLFGFLLLVPRPATAAVIPRLSLLSLWSLWSRPATARLRTLVVSLPGPRALFRADDQGNRDKLQSYDYQ